MRNKVLIASRGGDEAAARIRALLRSAGLDVETLDVAQAPGAGVYEGPVLGSAIDLGIRRHASGGGSARAA